MIYGVLEIAGEISPLRFFSLLISTQRFGWTDMVLPITVLVIEFLLVAIAGTLKWL